MVISNPYSLRPNVPGILPSVSLFLRLDRARLFEPVRKCLLQLLPQCLNTFFKLRVTGFQFVIILHKDVNSLG